MRESKRGLLEADGWQIGDPTSFLGLSPEEAAFVELKIALADHLRQVRQQNGWTQVQVADRLHTSQSRLAMMEAADPSVSVDLLIRALLGLGLSRSEVAAVIAEAA